MTIKMRLSRILAASALAASTGLTVGFAASAAAAPPAGPGDVEVCTVGCSHHPEPTVPDDLANPTENPDPEGPDEPTEDSPSDAPIPADANFTG